MTVETRRLHQLRPRIAPGAGNECNGDVASITGTSGVTLTSAKILGQYPHPQTIEKGQLLTRR